MTAPPVSSGLRAQPVEFGCFHLEPRTHAISRVIDARSTVPTDDLNVPDLPDVQAKGGEQNGGGLQYRDQFGRRELVGAKPGNAHGGGAVVLSLRTALRDIRERDLVNRYPRL